MSHYYFDIHDGETLTADEEGHFLPNLEAAQVAAARTLADLARDAIRGFAKHAKGHKMIIAVRDVTGPVLKAQCTFEVGP
jgi:hypothetical protein